MQKAYRQQPMPKRAPSAIETEFLTIAAMSSEEEDVRPAGMTVMEALGSQNPDPDWLFHLLQEPFQESVVTEPEEREYHFVAAALANSITKQVTEPEERRYEELAQAAQEDYQKIEEGLEEVLKTLSSLPLEQTGESENTMTTVIEVRQEIHPVLALVESVQERNEDFYRKLLDTQLSIEGAIGDVYRQGIEVEKQGETFLRIWSENIEDIREEHAK